MSFSVILIFHGFGFLDLQQRIFCAESCRHRLGSSRESRCLVFMGPSTNVFSCLLSPLQATCCHLEYGFRMRSCAEFVSQCNLLWLGEMLCNLRCHPNFGASKAAEAVLQDQMLRPRVGPEPIRIASIPINPARAAASLIERWRRSRMRYTRRAISAASGTAIATKHIHTTRCSHSSSCQYVLGHAFEYVPRAWLK